MISNLISKLHKLFTFFTRLYVIKDEPVVILAPGRVGSMAIHQNLEQNRHFVFKVEFADMEASGSVQLVRKHILYGSHTAKIISLVRDPISLMLTYFIRKSNRGWISAGQKAIEEGDIQKLQELFITEVLQTYRLSRHLTWFENDFLKMTAIDVYKHAFDTDKKYSVIEHKQYPTIIMRTELADEEKSMILNEFLGTNTIEIRRSNTTSTQPFAAMYTELKQSITIPTKLLEEIYSSKFCSHFFSSKERDQLIQRWSKNEKFNQEK